MTVPLDTSSATPAHDTPTTTEVVARSLPELEALLTRPRAEGEPLHVLIDGPAAEQIFGEGMAATLATGGEAVAR